MLLRRPLVRGIIAGIAAAAISGSTATAAEPPSRLAAKAPAGAAASAAPVCAMFCDTRDPSLARRETFPVGELIVNGRRVNLHVSDPDGMAWASIDDGRVGDEAWIDRSWDRGTSGNWEGLLGRVSITGSRTGARTLMYNQYDPGAHRRGVVRACGNAGGTVGCTAWVYQSVCDKFCDNREVPGSTQGSRPVPDKSILGRTVALHVSAADGMAWGSIAGGGPGDEIWLDRSWDGGATWTDGSSLGRTRVGSAQAGTRTTMFNVRDPRGWLYGGAVRACGKAAERPEGTCTAWARPGDNRADAAADALMWSYNIREGLFLPSGWWNSATSFTTMLNYLGRPGAVDYRWIIGRTFDLNRGVFPAGVKSGDAIEGDFRSRSIDDSAWWGLAWIEAYDLTGDRRYLDTARTIGDYLHEYWDNTCGGGVWWNRERTYKNAVTNGLYIRLSAALHRRIAGDTQFLRRAETGWSWLRNSGMINSRNLVQDGLDGCAGTGTVWTYNQGLAVGALVELWRANGDNSLLTTARTLADAAIDQPELTRNGILTETCDQPGQNCNDDQKQFKGVFMRFLADLARATGAAKYRQFAQRQADVIWAQNRDSLNRLGQRWDGSAPNPRDYRTQASAMAAVIASP